MTAEAESHDPHLFVARRDPAQAQIVAVQRAPLLDGEVRVRLDRFGLTTNNITYAAAGETFHYNKFFPAPEPLHSEGWVGLPVWGLATVTESRSPLAAVGAGVYGFFPAAGHAVLAPAREHATGFTVERPQLPPEFAIYHQYHLTDRDPFHLQGQDDWVVVFRPLLLTGLLLADQIIAFDFYGAGAVVISSASSKTAYGVAAALRRGPAGREIIGLSSAKNREFAAGLGVYDRVVEYGDLGALPRGVGVVHVDVAGGPHLRAALFAALRDELRLDLGVGMTHGAPASRGGARSEFFFAPAWVLRRVRERGPGFLGELAAGWRALVEGLDGRFHVERAVGAEAVLGVHRALAAGQIAADVAPVLSLSVGA